MSSEIDTKKEPPPLRMEPGQTYEDFDAFKEALDAHCRENNVIFNIGNAKTVEQANKIFKKSTKLDPKFKYVNAVFVCKHYGSYRSRSIGSRPNQRTYKINCKAFINISASRQMSCLIVRDSYHVHSHPCTEDIYNSYPEVRRTTYDEKKLVSDLFTLGISIKEVKTAIGRPIHSRDISNIKGFNFETGKFENTKFTKNLKRGSEGDNEKPSPKRLKTDKSNKNSLRVEKITEKSVTATRKSCQNCSNYMSPLDTHSLCLSCLGPKHFHEDDCEHCAKMNPEQLAIRKKQVIKMKVNGFLQSIETNNEKLYLDSDNKVASVTNTKSPRKSERVRKPKQFGPDISVENNFVKNGAVDKPVVRNTNKYSANDDENNFSVDLIKQEHCDDYEEDTCNSFEKTLSSQNSDRFFHLLNQTTVLEGVQLDVCSDGEMGYKPDESTSREIHKLELNPNLPAAPKRIIDKCMLPVSFEEQHFSHCQNTEATSSYQDSKMKKLATNSMVNMRLSIYDKLFSRLGVGMADEALTIISDLYSKIMNVTEISQETLSSELQSASDAILALKDVLEEIGSISSDAFTSAAYQRSLTLNSLNLEVKQNKRSSTDATLRKGKFKPFSSLQIASQKRVRTSPKGDKDGTTEVQQEGVTLFDRGDTFQKSSQESCISEISSQDQNELTSAKITNSQQKVSSESENDSQASVGHFENKDGTEVQLCFVNENT